MLHGPFQEVSQIWVVPNYVSSKFSHEEIAILGESTVFFLCHVMPRLIPTRHSGERSKSASAGRCSICTVRSYHKWTWLESGLDVERILLAKCNFSIYIYFYVFVAINHLNASAACACHGSKAFRFLIFNSIPSLVRRDLAWLALSF